ncbi:MAG: LacI family DNA-binding transcriptional regulator [Caldisericaceae bacterium]|nr:LacI family DNA-binding transcriptional regulator [Caldisericaceae bacterium]
MSKFKTITLQDLANELNVSKVTISKALRDHPDIAPETKRKIKQLAAKRGYTPNLMARNLAARQTFTLGLVTPKIAHSFFARVIETFYNCAFEQGYEVVLMVSQEEEQRQIKHLQTLMSMKVDGILISVAQNTRDLTIFEEIKKRNIPLVFFDRIVPNLGFSTVSADDYQGGFLAVQQAFKAGYRHLAHVAGSFTTQIGRERLRGFKDGLKKFDLPFVEEWVVESGYSEQAGYRAAQKLLNQMQLPEVIFGVTFPATLGILTALQENGLKVPQDMDLIAFGDSQFNRFLKPAITCIDQPTENLAQSAFNLLMDTIKNKEEFAIQNQVIPVKLKEYDTCRSK